MSDPHDTRNPEPTVSRPHIGGYDVPQMSDGMLPWEWARERLARSHNYWLTTTRPDGAPHTMRCGACGSMGHGISVRAPRPGKHGIWR